MGSSSSSLSHIPDGQQLMGETGFSAAHLLRLHERFELLDKDSRGHLRPEDFEEIRELTENPVGGRIIGAFFPPEKETLDFPSFVRILAHFRPTGKNRSRDRTQPEPANSRTGKLKFAFKLYDQDRDGKISRDELLQVHFPTITNTKHHCFIKQVEKVTSQIEQCIICIETDLLHMCVQVLRAMLGLQVTEEQLQSIAERAIQEADLNSDGAISFDEFKKSLEKVDIEHKMSIRFLK
ncbi:Calcineurin B homologous protein 2 [Oryzias melastigma]|uniref:Calcineurin B homologous protein 2 n=1 Tax=Oryzias melastigma TaxID=30732 RepID=A0A834F654_ORYME|nr:Calcineurin B homologous protein 2 [Oryzias melastigma]